MKVQHFFSLILLFVLITNLLFPTKPEATSWVYSFVVWNGYIYVVSEEYVTEIGSEIGHVTRFSDMKQYAGNFSNSYKRGTKYYSIEGIRTDVAIAVEDQYGQYRKAVREGEYTYSRGISDYLGFVIGFLVILVIATIVYGFVKTRLIWKGRSS